MTEIIANMNRKTTRHTQTNSNLNMNTNHTINNNNTKYIYTARQRYSKPETRHQQIYRENGTSRQAFKNTSRKPGNRHIHRLRVI